MKNIDYKKAQKIFEDLSQGEHFSLAENHFLVLTSDQYEKYNSMYDTSSMTMEMFQPTNYGIVLLSTFDSVGKGDIVFFPPMRGHNMLLHEKKDVALKLFDKHDYLMKTTRF